MNLLNNRMHAKTMILDIARQFAELLDAEDYAAVEKLIADDCVYLCRGEVFRGPAAIIQLYCGNGETAKSSFDEVRYESAVSAESASLATIHFVDHLRRQDQTFTFECEQKIEINDCELIVKIEHFDRPGQVETLAEFKRSTNV